MAILFNKAKLFCNYGRGSYEQPFCETILNSSQWFRRRHLKIFIFLALASILFSRAQPFVQSLVEGIMRNNSVIFFLNLGQLLRCLFEDISTFSSGGNFV